MFDGLKEKLNSFTEEAEEDVETEAAEEEDAEATADAEATDEPAPEAAAGEDADAESGEAPENDSPEGAPGTAESDAASEPAEPDAGAPVDQRTDTDPAPTGGDAKAAPADEGAAETAPETAGDDAADDESDDDLDGRGLTERAKLFATGKTVIDEDDLADHLEDLEFALLGSDVELEVAQEILDGVEENLVGETRRRLQSTGNILRDALRESLYDVISVGQFDFDERVAGGEKPFVIIFTGVNGVGKTTTIAKLAQYFEKRGLSTVLANGDTYRAGANEQLQQHADNLGKKVISHEKGSDPAAVIYDAVEYADANDVDVVLGDTAGRLHTSDGLMDQLAKIDRVIEPDMTIFVDEAVAGQDAVNRAREFDDASDIDGTVLTKADADSQGGAAISIAHVTGKPILFLGTGQEYDDLERFDPERIVDQLLGEE
jgi:fused signal recognition particle receptor